MSRKRQARQKPAVPHVCWDSFRAFQQKCSAVCVGKCAETTRALLERPCHIHAVKRLFLERRHSRAGKRVGALVFRMAGMALDPMPLDLVALAGLIQRLPKLDILDWLVCSRLPAVLLPAVDPARNPVAHVIAVGIEVHLARFLQRVQRFRGGLQLHAIVGRGRLATLQLFLGAVETQHGAPAAWSRVTGTCTIRINFDSLHPIPTPYSLAEPICRWNRIRRRYSKGSRFLIIGPSGMVSQS